MIDFIPLSEEVPQPRRAPFRFNELLAVLDDAGNDTGERCVFVGIQLNYLGEETGEAHVSVVKGNNRAIKLHLIKAVSH
jgi:hypothetical protein